MAVLETVEIDHLRRLAQRATQGGWKVEKSDIGRRPVWVRHVTRESDVALAMRPEDAAYIAAMSPQKLLALLAELEELRANNYSPEREAEGKFYFVGREAFCKMPPSPHPSSLKLSARIRRWRGFMRKLATFMAASLALARRPMRTDGQEKE